MSRGKQHALDGLELPRETQLAIELEPRKCCVGEISLRGRQQDAERDRQIVAATFLGEIGRRQIDSDATGREFEARIRQRCTHAVLALLHRGLWQADYRKGGQAAAEVHFDDDPGRVQSELSAARDTGDSHDEDRAMISP